MATQHTFTKQFINVPVGCVPDQNSIVQRADMFMDTGSVREKNQDLQEQPSPQKTSRKYGEWF